MGRRTDPSLIGSRETFALVAPAPVLGSRLTKALGCACYKLALGKKNSHTGL